MDALTPTEVRALLDQYGLAPRKRDGQNFVVDPNTVRKIVRDADIGPQDTVLEIGPGLGSLTRPLLDVALRVVAVEIDAGLVRVLEDTLGDQPGFELHHADVMDLDLRALAGDTPLRVVANLPYNVATPILFHVLESGVADDLYVMVQREVGERWAAGPGSKLYAGVTVRLSWLADVSVESSVARTVFDPVPNVDSVMVRIRTRPAPLDYEAMAEVVDTAFGQRRKTLRRSLRELGDVEAACRVARIDPGARPETVDPRSFAVLARSLRFPA